MLHDPHHRINTTSFGLGKLLPTGAGITGALVNVIPVELNWQDVVWYIGAATDIVSAKPSRRSTRWSKGN